MFASSEDAWDTSDVLGVELVAFVDFHIYDGTKLSSIYPEDANLEPEFSLQHLANCSLPDGAHLHLTDQSYLVLPTKSGIKYGIAFFLNKSDSGVCRGAIQRALLVVSSLPHFHLFEEPSYKLLEYSTTNCKESPIELLKLLYNCFKIPPEKVITTTGLDQTRHHITVNLFKDSYRLKVPADYQPGQFDGVSLLDLVKTLGVCC